METIKIRIIKTTPTTEVTEISNRNSFKLSVNRLSPFTFKTKTEQKINEYLMGTNAARKRIMGCPLSWSPRFYNKVFFFVLLKNFEDFY